MVGCGFVRTGFIHNVPVGRGGIVVGFVRHGFVRRGLAGCGGIRPGFINSGFVRHDLVNSGFVGLGLVCPGFFNGVLIACGGIAHSLIARCLAGNILTGHDRIRGGAPIRDGLVGGCFVRHDLINCFFIGRGSVRLRFIRIGFAGSGFVGSAPVTGGLIGRGFVQSAFIRGGFAGSLLSGLHLPGDHHAGDLRHARETVGHELRRGRIHQRVARHAVCVGRHRRRRALCQSGYVDLRQRVGRVFHLGKRARLLRQGQIQRRAGLHTGAQFIFRGRVKRRFILAQKHFAGGKRRGQGLDLALHALALHVVARLRHLQIGRARGAVLVIAQGGEGVLGLARPAARLQFRGQTIAAFAGVGGGVLIFAQRGKGGLRLSVTAGLLLREGNGVGTGVDALARVLVVGNGLQNGDGLAVSAGALQLHAPRIGAAVRRQPEGQRGDDCRRRQNDEGDLPPAQFSGRVAFRHIFSSFGI